MASPLRQERPMTEPYTPTVYVVQDIRKNMLGARTFGNLTCILDEDEELSPLNVGRITKKLRERLKDFTANDYLLCAGNPISIGIAFMIAADLTGGIVKALKWDNQEHIYWSVTIDLEELDQ